MVEKGVVCGTGIGDSKRVLGTLNGLYNTLWASE